VRINLDVATFGPMPSNILDGEEQEEEEVRLNNLADINEDSILGPGMYLSSPTEQKLDQPQAVFARNPERYLSYGYVKYSYLIKQACNFFSHAKISSEQLLIAILAFVLSFIQSSLGDSNIIPTVVVLGSCTFNLVCGLFIIYSTSWVLMNQPPPKLDTHS
jgi:hypothetical protein